MAKPRINSLSYLFSSIILFLSFFLGKSIHFNLDNALSWLNDQDDDEVTMVQSRHSSLKSCDFSYGKWVYDQTYPLYDSNCPYLSSAVTCKKNGRPDSDYEKWKWKPHRCSIPRYSVKPLLVLKFSFVQLGYLSRLTL